MRFRSLLVLLSASGAMAQTDIARQLVNPFIGTGGHGHTFPGACVPNGLVQLSPDTRPDGYNDWDGCGGYHDSDSLIYGFSHTHLSGTGVADLCDVLITPVAGDGGMAFDGSATRSRFSHSSEEAHAGYYKVDLLGPPPSSADGASIPAARPTRIEGSSIRAELTATPRVGVHRYVFPKGQAARIVLNLSHRDKLMDFGIREVGTGEVVGERRSSSWARDQRLFFCIRFSSPIKEVDVLPSNLIGRGAGYDFGLLEQPLIVKVGISAVSIEGARQNLEAEVPHWDFDQVRAEAEAAWNAKLAKVQVQGGTREQQRIFYTALYHCYVAPYIFNDVDGQYRGMDGEVHHADHDVYTVFSLWDTFRSLHPLMALLEPDMTRDWVRTFLLHYAQGGRLPVWELWGNETDCMIGHHSVSVIADAYLKGIRDFDVELALEAMTTTAEADRFGLDAYRKRGYISSEDAPESVSRTLEYAYDDHCIARFAEAIGAKEVADRYFDRSRNWQNLFDPDTKFFRARRNGGYVEPFDPYEVNFHFTEANAWQYGLFVPHDMDRFIQLQGGLGPFTARLDALFEADPRTTGREQSDITGLIGQYAHGNEPSHSFAYLYNRSTTPWKTDLYIAKIMREFYHDAPDGLSGNEDCGQMSAWYVWSALGLYPAAPGSTELVFGIPLFDSVTVDQGEGRSFTVTSTTNGDNRTHVESIAWNGSARQRTGTIAHTELVSGGSLHFLLGPRHVDHPLLLPSDERPIGPPPVPILQAPAPAFTDSMTVAVRALAGPWELRCALDDAPLAPCPERFLLHTSQRITAVSHDPATGVTSPTVGASFTKVEGGRTITLESSYANQYAASGPQALIDGLRGGPDFRTGEWQGFQGQDLSATIDLGRPMKVTGAALSVLQDQRSWIWYPAEVEFAFSTNGRQWSTARATNTIPRDHVGSMTTTMGIDGIGKRARYVKVIARSTGPCPEWHPGHGGASWIFADEVLITTE